MTAASLAAVPPSRLPTSHACWSCCVFATLLQVLQESGAEAVLSFALPFHADSCGCAVAHLLGVPLVAVDGNPLVVTPLSTPQVRHCFSRVCFNGRPSVLSGMGDLQCWCNGVVPKGYADTCQAHRRLLQLASSAGVAARTVN